MLQTKEILLIRLLEKISSFFTDQVYEYIYISYRDYYDRIMKLEELIHISINLNGNMEEYIALLVEYWHIHIKGYTKYLQNRLEH